MNESILRTRHSARKFQDKEIGEELIREIIEDAQQAPSWCNSQPAKAYVLVGTAAKKMAQTHHNNNVSGAKSWAEVMPPQEETWTEENASNMQEFFAAAGVMDGMDDRLGMLEGNSWDFNSPAIVYITIPKAATFYQAYDAGAFGYGISLSAHEHGLSSIPAYEFVRYPQEVREAIDIPEDESLIIGIGIGYAADAEINSLHETCRRMPVDKVLTIKAE